MGYLVGSQAELLLHIFTDADVCIIKRRWSNFRHIFSKLEATVQSNEYLSYLKGRGGRAGAGGRYKSLEEREAESIGTSPPTRRRRRSWRRKREKGRRPVGVRERASEREEKVEKSKEDKLEGVVF